MNYDLHLTVSNTFKENSFGEEKFNDSLQIESDVTETTEKKKKKM